MFDSVTDMKATFDIERVLELVQENQDGLSNYGICGSCGHEQDGCEPDARNYECESCGKKNVFGAEEALFMI